MYFDDEAAEVVINSLRLGDDPDRYFLVHANWPYLFASTFHLVSAK